MEIRTNGNIRLARRRRSLLLGCAALALLAHRAALAQDAPTEGADVDLNPIVVEGGVGDDDANSIVAVGTTGAGKVSTPILDTPASVSVITAKEIEARGAENVEEVIQYTSGVLTDFYGADDRFDFFKIRGFDAYIYRDGLTLGDPFGGVREEPYAFERVEVLKGASSTAFGVSDPGGAVNVVSKRPRREAHGEVFGTVGSFDRLEGGFDVGGNVTKDDTLSYRFTAKLREADAEYDHSRDDLKFFMGGVTWRPTDATDLTVLYDHLDRDGVPGSGGYPVGVDFDRSTFFGEPDFNYLDNKRDTVTALLEHDFGSGLSFSSSARYHNADRGFGYAYISSTPTDGSTLARRSFFATDATQESFIIDAHLLYERSFGDVDSRTLVGVESNTVSTDTDTFFGAAPSIDWTNPVYTGRPASVPLFASVNSDQDTTAVYLQQDFTFWDRFIVSAGLRHDWIDITQLNNLTGVTTEAEISEPSRRLGLTYKITDEISAFASYAESVVPGSSLTVAPERGEQLEIGLKYQPEAFPALFTASLYDLTKSNITRTNPATSLPETIGEVRVRGIDLEAKANLTSAISLTAAYSYMQSEIVENGTAGNEGNELSFVPNHIASLWVSYLLEGEGARGDMTFGVGARYSGSYFFDDANTQSTDSSIVLDAAFTYDLTEETSLEVRATNLFDEKHVAYGGFGADFYNPGRTVFATLRHTW